MEMEEGKRKGKTKRGQDKGSREGAHGEDWTGDDGDGLAGIRSSLRQDEGSLRNGSTALTPGPLMLAGPLHLRSATGRIGAWAVLLLAACFAPNTMDCLRCCRSQCWECIASQVGGIRVSRLAAGAKKSLQALAGSASTGSP